MPKFYAAVFKEFQKELKRCSTEIFLYPLPFTQINHLAMLAATVAVRCAAEQSGVAVDALEEDVRYGTATRVSSAANDEEPEGDIAF